MSLPASRNNLIRELFVRSADENYITARWCAANGLHIDFLWLAVHALEKYLKAVLLTNGRTAKKYGHDIVRLFESVRHLAGPLLPDRLLKPRELSIHHWRERSAAEFIQHLMSNGNAENRYLIFGYVTSGEDLHMLDEMVFAIRRLVCALDDRYLQASQGVDAPTFTNRELLALQPVHYSRMGMPLDDEIAATVDTPKRIAALNLNLSFAPADFSHGQLPGGSASRNPALYRRIIHPLEVANREGVEETIELAEWFLANVKVMVDIETQIREAVITAKKRHGIV